LENLSKRIPRNRRVLTIETWLNGIGLKQPIEECPAWPPDLYALAGALIRRSGAYLRLFEHRGIAPYLNGIEQAAEKWRKQIDAITAESVTVSVLQSVRVSDVVDAWASLIRARAIPISEIDRELAERLIRMTLIADEASAGIGINWGYQTDEGPRHSKFLSIAEQLLVTNELQSFCWEVPRDVLCVLGKQHTPVKGATFRSLSHHLALYHPNEIEARWVNPIPKMVAQSPSREGLNLLLLPWPMRVTTEDFQEVSTCGVRRDGSEPPGYFRYAPKESDDPERFATKLRQALASAHRQAGTIDAIVFPELALTEPQYYVAEQIAFEARCILVCGLRQAGTAAGDWDANLSVLQAAGAVRGPDQAADAQDPLLSDLRLFQAKHHRWYLDRAQIVNYQLGGRFLASRGCWEHIDLPRRVLHFVTLNATTWTVLVCEDLARQDPAADLIRAVGPNHLIALLMDGPQLSGRWPARYASVLAEDPGTSVLTLTSLGMAERSRPIIQSGQRASPSRVIALWRDAVEGEIQIALDTDDDACVLSLEYQLRTEYCADGRSDHGQTRYPVYAGYRSFKTGS
jgi:hypothetical protein